MNPLLSIKELMARRILNIFSSSKIYHGICEKLIAIWVIAYISNPPLKKYNPHSINKNKTYGKRFIVVGNIY